MNTATVHLDGLRQEDGLDDGDAEGGEPARSLVLAEHACHFNRHPERHSNHGQRKQVPDIDAPPREAVRKECEKNNVWWWILKFASHQFPCALPSLFKPIDAAPERMSSIQCKACRIQWNVGCFALKSANKICSSWHCRGYSPKLCLFLLCWVCVGLRVGPVCLTVTRIQVVTGSLGRFHTNNRAWRHDILLGKDKIQFLEPHHNS